MTRFRSNVVRFLKDERGVLLAESLIMLPFMIWGFIALVVYWDLFRVMNVSQKAAYSISDLLSRQAVLTDEFLDGQLEILDFLTPGAENPAIRITSLQLEEGPIIEPEFDADDSYCLLFSRTLATDLFDPDIPGPHTQGSIQLLSSQIPDMNDLESVVVVETWVDYLPDFDTGVLNAAPGVTEQTFYQFIVTRPRNWRRVTLDSEPFVCP
jgi:hypothetical protein